MIHRRAKESLSVDVEFHFNFTSFETHLAGGFPNQARGEVCVYASAVVFVDDDDDRTVVIVFVIDFNYIVVGRDAGHSLRRAERDNAASECVFPAWADIPDIDEVAFVEVCGDLMTFFIKCNCAKGGRERSNSAGGAATLLGFSCLWWWQRLSECAPISRRIAIRFTSSRNAGQFF